MSAERATAASRSASAMRKSASSRSIVSATWLRSYPRRTTSNECWASCIGSDSWRGSLMPSSSQMVDGASACRWPSRDQWGQVGPSHAPEAVDRVEVLGALLLVADAEALFRGEGEDADLALVGVVVDVVGGLADVVHRVHLRQRRVDQALVDEPVGLPRLLVVGEVTADDPLEVHPQVPVVVGMHVPRRGGAGDDRAAL